MTKTRGFNIKYGHIYGYEYFIFPTLSFTSTQLGKGNISFTMVYICAC